jgi:transcriptional regulator with XRE-family HTH domain
MPTPDKQLSAEQSRQIADTIREEIARRRISRQSLAELAKLSLSTLEKVLGGRRPFTLATTVRLEQALGVSLRKAPDASAPAAPNGNGDIAPDGLGAYSRRAVAWIEGTYVTVRPSFGDKDAIFAYRTEIAWDDAASSLLFHESERQDAAFTQFGEVAVPNQSGPHLPHHQPARPASLDHGIASENIRRNVRHHHDAAGGARLAADADCRPDRLFAPQDGR